MSACALVGADVFDGTDLKTGCAVITDARGLKVVPEADVPDVLRRVVLDKGTLMPGFVDLQVNGGGGMMLNDRSDVATLETMAAAHHTLGTRAFLPTLITDTPDKTDRAIKAVTEAKAAGVPGIIGLHLEGPHLDVRRKGAHAATLIRPMEEADLRLLLDAVEKVGNLMVTVAPEAISMAQIKALAKADVVVSIGHSDTDYDTAMRAFEAGARCVTHLFNAMSQLGSRTPGLVGAALGAGSVSAGLIADGIHVHPATIRAALEAKRGPGKIFLVTDAMATAGSDIDRFTLNGREILRAEGRLTLADGTLAGADLSMAQALRVMIKDVGDAPERAFARATSIPAGLLRDAGGAGTWPETVEGLIYLSKDFQVQAASDLI